MKKEVLSRQEQRFLNEYAIDLDVIPAMIRAGYAESYARNMFRRVIERPKIASEMRKIEERRAQVIDQSVRDQLDRESVFKVMEDVGVTKKWLFEKLKSIVDAGTAKDSDGKMQAPQTATQACNSLLKAMGIAEPPKIQASEDENSSGVLEVPATKEKDDWENAGNA